MIVADSDVLIDAPHGREPSAQRVAESLEAGTLATTAVSAFELSSGARTPKQEEVVATLLAAMTILPLDQKASEAAARMRQELEPQGQAIGMADYLIAGVCVSRSAALLTRNRRHFQRIPVLSFADH